MIDITYIVPEMSCAHCERAVRDEVLAIAGVEAVDVDLHAKTVLVHGVDLDDARLRAAIGDAGYEAA
jgi:copper chaperone